MSRRFRVELRGQDARLGVVPAADVARLLLGVERALARQTAHALGRPAAERGRWEAVVANAVRVRLAAIEEGSVVPVLELPDFGVDGLALQAETLGEEALTQILDVISGDRSPEPDVAQAFTSLANDLDIGRRYESIVFDHTNGGGRRVAVIDAPARSRMQEAATRPTEQRPAAVRGTLVEADFERYSARLRTPTGAAVSVTFSPELADAIDEALRRPAEFEGEVTYDPNSAVATAIRLREVIRPQRLWESEDYFTPQSLADLAASGAVVAVARVDELHAAGPSEGDDLDAFFAAIAHDPE